MYFLFGALQAELRWSVFYVGVNPYANILHPYRVLVVLHGFLA